MLWSYGVTTVPERRDSTLLVTLKSLSAAGFPKPRLFVDGSAAGFPRNGLPITSRESDQSKDPPFRRLGAWGNWFSALFELYAREPVCERYAIFQDDVLAVRDLREYLDSCRYPDGTDGRPPGYWNLVTMRGSEWDVQDRGTNCGWIEGYSPSDGMSAPLHHRLQKGAGALGLVFNRRAASIILSSPLAVNKPISTDQPRRNVDGAVVTIMNLHRRDPQTGDPWPTGWREYVHGPSLLQHTGRESTVDEGKTWEKGAETFPGEDWSAAVEMTASNQRP